MARWSTWVATPRRPTTKLQLSIVAEGRRKPPFFIVCLAVKAMKYSFVFICQQGELEIKSLLLAASLKRFLRCDYELVAALPQPEALWGQPSATALDLLETLGVRQVQITNPIGHHYPIGNKLACLNIETSADKIVFLDSDMLCLREFRHSRRFERAFNAKPADLHTFGAAPGEWARVYAAFGLDFPSVPVLATVSGETMPPYFNAGMIAVRRDAGLGEVWVDCACAINANPAIGNKRPWLDQIALPVALAKLGLDFDSLDERFNYPAHLKPIDVNDLPCFCHYHRPDILRREPVANALVRELAEEHSALHRLMDRTPDWQALLKPHAVRHSWTLLPGTSASSRLRKADRGADMLITGIPRSGTSYLCSILNRVRDCVVVNEPAQIFTPLVEQKVPWGVATHYRDLRRDILMGKPIQNKLHNGEFIEDTAVVDVVNDYLPSVSRPDFLLATKNTLAYLARLPQLRRAMPDSVIVLCVRNPLDTIASWKTTFNHLSSADVSRFPVGNPQDDKLSLPERQRLDEISGTPSLALRRALLWRHLAEFILGNRDRILLLHYEEVVAQPASALQTILAAANGAVKLKAGCQVLPSAIRTKRDQLDEEDMRAIRSVCGQVAAELGYYDI